MDELEIAQLKETVACLYNDFQMVKTEHGRKAIMDAILKLESNQKKWRIK